MLPAAAGAAAKETYTTVASPVTSGPADCSKIRVLKIGPSSAKNVLVMIPGYLGGSGDFRVIGQRLTGKLKKLQVWGIDRRSQCLEDLKGFNTGNPVTALNYYLLGSKIGTDMFKAPAAGESGYEAARTWGLSTTMADIHAVVQAAKSGGRKVILGGHSLGGSLTDVYATWDFNGTAGYKDLSGLVLVDGGSRGTFGSGPSDSAIAASLTDINTGVPFSSLIAGVPSYYLGVFPELTAKFAKLNPAANSVMQGLLGGFPAFSAFTTSAKLNNAAQLGYAFDRDTSPTSVGLLHINAGGLTTPANPAAAKGWSDAGGITDIKDVETLFGTEPGNFVEWYFPKRLSLDVSVANGLSKTSQTDSLGLRPWHLADVNLPLYAFETGLTCSARPLPTAPGFAAWIAANKATKCGVLQGAQSFVAGSKVPRSTLVSDHNAEHLDPLVARAKDNKFQTTVITFLKSLGIR